MLITRRPRLPAPTGDGLAGWFLIALACAVLAVGTFGLFGAG